MNTLGPAIGLLVVAAITPGPNNILMMNATLQGGWQTAAKILFAILTGSLALFTLVNLGLSLASDQFPILAKGAVVIGAFYLAWTGLTLMIFTPSNSRTDGLFSLTSLISIATFQLINPKGWVLMSVFLAASAGNSLFVLSFILLVTLAVCLSAWAFAGFALKSAYQNPVTRHRIDFCLGGTLLLFAILIAIQNIMTDAA